MKKRYKLLSGLLMVFAVAIAGLAIVLGHDSDCPPSPPQLADASSIKAIVYRCYGSSDVLHLEEISKPVPAAGEVLVRVHAAAINPLDWHYMRGSPYFMRLASGIGAPEDIRLGVDFAGTVEAVGESVKQFRPGDRVFGGRTGAFAEYVTVAEDRAISSIPPDVTFEQAASVPIAALTALQALRDKGKLQPGQKVLINGASGGVGTFAVQIAKWLGAEVTGVCSTRNVAMVQSIGADRVIDYKKENYTDGDERYDLIVDMVGNHSLLANRSMLEPDGILVIVGGSGGDWVQPLMQPLGAMLLSPLVDQDMMMILAELHKDDLATVAKLMESGVVTPVIDRRFSLSDVPAAIDYSESGRARGKIIINVDSAGAP